MIFCSRPSRGAFVRFTGRFDEVPKRRNRAPATIKANATTGWDKIDNLVAASNYALLASQELAVAHEGATASIK